MEELKSCAHCGSQAELCESKSHNFFVRCTNKQCASRTRNYNSNRNGAISSWNTRYQPTCKLYVKDNTYHCSVCDCESDPNMNYCECCGSRIDFDGESSVEVVD